MSFIIRCDMHGLGRIFAVAAVGQLCSNTSLPYRAWTSAPTGEIMCVHALSMVILTPLHYRWWSCKDKCKWTPWIYIASWFRLCEQGSFLVYLREVAKTRLFGRIIKQQEVGLDDLHWPPSSQVPSNRVSKTNGSMCFVCRPAQYPLTLVHLFWSGSSKNY